MKKKAFLSALEKRLSGLPRQDVEERLNFYSEMIDDRMEDGKSEEEAVSEIGTVDEVAAQIVADIPFSKIAKEKFAHKRQLHTWEIVLLILGAPVWFSLLVAAFSIILSLYVVLWSLVIAVWTVFASVGVCAVCGIFAGIILAATKGGFFGIAIIGLSVICAGLAIFLYIGSVAATKGAVILPKKIIRAIKCSL